jgi:hypothetical protein
MQKKKSLIDLPVTEPFPTLQYVISIWHDLRDTAATIYDVESQTFTVVHFIRIIFF